MHGPYVHAVMVHALVGGMRGTASESPSALQKIEDENDHCEHEKDVDPATQCVAADKAKYP
jgi:hypothetical protein